MSKSVTLSVRIDPELKQKADEVFRRLGLTASQAIVLFYKQVELQQGLPFAVRLPNATTRKALEEAQERRNLKDFENVDDLFEDLEH